MKNINKIKKEIETTLNLIVKKNMDGLEIYPKANENDCIYEVTLRRILIIADYYKLSCYISFSPEYIRLH